MKRSIVFIAALALLLAGCGSKEPAATTGPTQVTSPPAPTTEPIIGTTRPTDGPAEPKTKTIYIRTASTSASDGAVARTEYIFDEQNLLTQVVVYTNGTETRRHSVECDENGNYIRWTSEGSRIEYSYDKSGNPLGHASYMGSALISETVYTWEGTLRTSATTRMPIQGLEHRTLMTYNESGKLIRQDNYDGTVLSSYCLYTLGEDGRPTVMTTYRADGTLEKTVSYSYEGNITTGTAAGPDGQMLQYTEQIHDEHGNLLSVTAYDAEGNMLTQQTHSWMAIEVPADSLRASV